MSVGDFAGLAALAGTASLALALIFGVFIPPSQVLAILGLGLLAVSVFVACVELKRTRPTVAILGMAAVGGGVTVAMLAGAAFSRTGGVALISLVGIGSTFPFLAAPVIMIACSDTGLVSRRAALSLAGASGVLLLATPVGGPAGTLSFATYLAVWSWAGLSLLAYARPGHQTHAP